MTGVTGPVTVRRDYVDVAHGQVHLRQAGAETSSPTLLCLHMSPASSLVYENVMAELGRSRRVIAPDTPGFGASDSLAEPPEIADYAEVMAELLDAERARGGGPVDLLGYHTGSLIALELAVRRPDLVRRVVTISMPVFTAAELAHFRAVYSTDPIFTEDGQTLLAKWRWFVGFFGVGRVNTVEDAGRIFLARLSGGPRHWWGHHAAFRYDVPAALTRLARPLTVLNLDDDLTVQTRRAVELLPAGAVVERPEWTHGFLDHDPAGAARAVTDLLDREDG